MNLREEILKEHSKSQKDKIVKWIGNDQKKFDQLFQLFLDDENVVMQRVAYPLSFVVEQYPGLIKKHLPKLIKNLRKPGHHNAIVRSTIRILQDVDIPGKLHGDVMNICFDYITDPQEKPAIKAFSLTVLQNLSRQYPDIKNEIKVIIKERWDQETMAFRSRARKILKELAASN